MKNQVQPLVLEQFRANKLARAISLLLAGFFSLRLAEVEAEDSVISARSEELNLSSAAAMDISQQPAASPVPSYLDIALQAVRVAPMSFGAPAPINIGTAGGIGISSHGAHDGATVNLAAANSVGVQAGAGAVIGFDQGTVNSTAVASSTAAGQKGLYAKDGGQISATAATIILTPKVLATGVAVKASNMVGVTAENAATISLSDSSVTTGGGTGTGNHALLAKGAESRIGFNGGSLSTQSTSSHAALAQDAGHIALDGVQISTSGASSSGVRAETGASASVLNSRIDINGAAATATSTAALHALSGAQISGSNVSANAVGNYVSGARADGAGSSVKLSGSQLSTLGSGSVANPIAAARATDGGRVELSGSGTQLGATGQYAHGLSVEGAGSSARVADAHIQVGGPRSIAINVVAGGGATVSNSQLLHANSGTAAPAVLVDGAGSTFALSDSSVTTQTDNGIGVRATAGASVSLDRSVITTAGKEAAGLNAANASIVANNLTIETFGDNNAMGAVADGNGKITLNGGSVTTHGDSVRQASFPHGLVARNPGGELIANGTSVRTLGFKAYGAVADDGGSMTLNNLSVVTTGEHSIGLYSVVEQVGNQFKADMQANNVSVETFGNHAAGAMVQQSFLDAPATLTLDNATVTTHGAAANGLHAGTGGTLAASNSSVVTHGDESHGAVAKSAPSSLSLQQSAIQTNGNGAHGALAQDGGQFSAHDTTIHALGQASAALHAQGTSDALTAINLDNSLLSNRDGATISVAGAADLTLDQVIAGGSGQWLQVEALEQDGVSTAGHTNLDLGKSLVSGSARTQAGSRADLNLHDTSLWQLSGTSNLSNLRNDASLIDFSAPVGNSYKTLTVNNYHGANGTIALNTHLYDDNSPSDKLVIDGGQASGSSNLAIKNAGGAGALTQGNGIMVVDALNGGSTDQEAFRLLNRVKAGPYEYNLYRGSRDDSNSEAWYLRSSQEEPDDPELPPKKPDDPDQPEKPEQPDKPNKPINPVQPEQPEKPTHPEQPEQPEKPARIAKPNKPLIPNYRRETSLYSAIPEMALRYSHAMLDTLHERVGEERRLNVEPLPSEAIDEYGPSLGWGRVIYQNGESASADYDINAFQVGLDLYRNEDSDGSQDLAGLSLGIGQLDGSVVHGNGQDAGDNALRAYSLGGYWTHFGPAGWYVDGVLQFHAFDIDAHSVDGESLHSDGRGFSASLETGYPFEIDDDLYVEPQAQVVVSRIELDSAHDSAAEVHFEDVDSLAGRLGVRIAQDWFREDDNGDIQRTNVWVRPSIWHEFRGQPQTEFSSADGYLPFAGDLQGTSGELNLGVDYQVDENTTFTFSAGYQEGFDDDSSSYEGILGVKIKF